LACATSPSLHNSTLDSCSVNWKKTRDTSGQIAAATPQVADNPSVASNFPNSAHPQSVTTLFSKRKLLHREPKVPLKGILQIHPTKKCRFSEFCSPGYGDSQAFLDPR
jgi:hypothetical protein